MSSKPVVELQRRPRAKTGSGLRRDAEAALTDPSTNHLDTKSPTAMQTSKKITSGQRGTNAVVSRSICFDLKNIFAPDEFDPDSSVLACGFPSGTSILRCRQFLSWIGPVIRVDRAPSIGGEANFVVVFASDEYAHLSTRQPLPFDDLGTGIVCRLVDKKPTFWDSWMPAWSNSERAPAPSVASAIPTTTPLGAGSTGEYPMESIMSGWSSLLNSDGVRNVGQNLSNFGSQMASSAQQGYTQATQIMGA